LLINLFINLEINFKNFYNDQGYRQAVLNIKEEIRPNDKILILPTYFQPLFGIIGEILIIKRPFYTKQQNYWKKIFIAQI